MQIQFPSSAPVSAGTTVSPAAQSAAVTWRLGQMLMATVIGAGGDDFTRLAIGDAVVSARTSLPLAAGQQLALRVTATGAQPTLTIQSAPTREDVATSSVNRGLARVLPQQADPQVTRQVVQILQQLGEAPATVRAALPADAARALLGDLETLRTALPSAADASAGTTLRVAVERAALPTEARVQAALDTPHGPDARGDLRALLARVAADLTPPTPTGNTPHAAHQATPSAHPTASAHAAPIVLRDRVDDTSATAPSTTAASMPLKDLVDDVVARLEANQLQSLPRADGTPTPLIVDLPLVHDRRCDLLHCEFERAQRDGTGSAGGEPVEDRVEFRLTLDDGHEVSARLRLSGDRLDVRLGANDPLFNEMLGANFDQLEAQLRAQGLEVGQLVLAALAPASAPRLAGRRLIDDRI